MDIISFANKAFSLGAIVGQIFLVGVIVYVAVTRKAIPWISRNGLLLAFLTALISMCGSLFYSQYVGFAPCELCWFQRIFMYPLVFLLGMAWAKKDRNIIGYGLVLAIIGLFVSAYQNYIYYFNEGLNATCTFGGLGVSCVKRYVFEFGYMTIPLMALTAFGLIIAFLLLQKYHEKHS